MMVFPCCKSNRIIDHEFIYVCPNLDFPDFPKTENKVIPLDADGKQVRDMNTDVVNVLMPYWYFNLIVNYKCAVDDTEIKYNAYKTKIKELEKNQKK